MTADQCSNPALLAYYSYFRNHSSWLLSLANETFFSCFTVLTVSPVGYNAVKFDDENRAQVYEEGFNYEPHLV